MRTRARYTPAGEGRPDGSRPSHVHAPAAPSLTLREREVLSLVVSGNRTGEIAHLLDISKKTVETHRAAIMRKLRLHRLADVVRYAVQNDLYAWTSPMVALPGQEVPT